MCFVRMVGWLLEFLLDRCCDLFVGMEGKKDCGFVRGMYILVCN